MTVPTSPRQPVTDTYHGIPVEDSYRWLEDGSDPAVATWTDAQNALTRQALDAIPFRAQVQVRIEELRTASSAQYYSLTHTGSRLFAMKRQPPLQQHLLVSMPSSADPAAEQVVLDPNALDPTGGTSIDFYVPSHDGRYAAVCLSKGGSEDGTVWVYDVATGQPLGDHIPRVNYPTAGGSLAWNGDATGFYYTRYPAEGERPAEDLHFYQQIYFHCLGEPAEKDTYLLGANFPRIAEILLQSTADGAAVLALVKNGDGGEVAHYVRDDEGVWAQVTSFADKIQDAKLGVDGNLYMLSRQDAPQGKIIRVALDLPSLANAETVVPERSGAIFDFLPGANHLYVVEMDGGPMRLMVFDRQGKPKGEVPVEPVSAIYELVRLDEDAILFNSGSFLTPPAWYHYDPRRSTTRRTGLFVSSPADFSDMEVVREFATSRDGTRVPINIIRKRGLALDGQNPVLLTGYGGYGISMLPHCSTVDRVWYDAGGVQAVANLRGGGEYGEAWHLAGNLVNKQNVFDDFIACAQHLIERGYTTPQKLAIIGGSNGGLLMGAVITQRPDLFGAVVSAVGIYDSLRVELDPNGEFNVTEFGTVTNPQHFEALYDYSPYHRVADGTAYPPVLFTTGDNDGRVNPYHSRKMTARLQAASTSGRPILLRTSKNTGHGFGTPLEEQIALETDVFTFLMTQTGARSGSG